MGEGPGGRRDGRPGVRQRIRYRFDNLLARGTSATLIWLGVVTAFAVFASSLLLTIAGVTFAGSDEGRWAEDVWQSLLRVMDPGTMAGDVGWGRRILALLITIFGLLVAGTLIGIIAAGVETRIDNMRRGRSVVIESGHVVVLGSSDRLSVVLHQLALAASADGGGTIVVLADLDPAEMRAAAGAASESSPSGVRIVYRSGNPATPADLALVRLPTARSVIVLSDRHSDEAAVEVLLAIASELGERHDLTVVVEVLDSSTARRVQRAYGSSVHPIVTSQAIARTSAVALRQRGLSQVVGELLDFRGCDLHIVERSDWVGVTFGALVAGLVNARPIAIRRADGEIRLAPPFDAVIESGDRIALLADDVGALRFTDRPGGPPWPLEHTLAGPGTADEHIVVVGWSDLGRQLLVGWVASAGPGSSAVVLVDEHQRDIEVGLPDLGPIRASVSAARDWIGDVVQRRPTTVVVLAPASDDAVDVDTILDVQALRRELNAHGGPRPRLVVELRDAERASLLELDGPDDLVISDALGSKFIAQLVDEPARRDVLLALYAADGAALRLVPCAQFDLVGDHTVAEVVDRLAAHGVLMIGWRRSPNRNGTVTLGPWLTERLTLHDDDELVVVG